MSVLRVLFQLSFSCTSRTSILHFGESRKTHLKPHSDLNAVRQAGMPQNRCSETKILPVFNAASTRIAAG
eukprot:4442453-Amphidinium_carterae.1